MNIIFIISITLSSTLAINPEENTKYFLNTEKCKLPEIKPSSPEVESIMKPQPYHSCNASELLTVVNKNSDTSIALVEVRKDLIPHYTTKNISCCISRVTRDGTLDEPDVGIKISNCQPFEEYVPIDGTAKITCYENDGQNQSKIIYENVHNAITTRSVEKKLKNNNDNKEFSVLFVVVDSISRLNFMRTMHQTYEYLLENNFVEMKGYTKIADNTFPNFVAFLTGLGIREMYRECKPTRLFGMDQCPLIWYDYRNRGYITAYAEDDSLITTFNYQKKGFVELPTDYYFKPYIEASETLNITFKKRMPYCTGPETSGERILNIAKDFTTTFKNQSTFGIFWMNTFSHNDINMPYLMDDKMKKFFGDLKSGGVLDESIVIFLSDHGVRFGDIRTTQNGWFEERMPINMISVPKSFQKKFGKAYQHLKDNSNKLTSTYDLFVTLEHILTLSGTNYTSKGSSACPNCRSLFNKIPESRSCEDAGISSEWCPCIGHFDQIDKNHDYVKNATDLILQKLNSYFVSLNETRLEELVSASVSESESLFVVLRTNNPSEIFLATVKFQEFVTDNSTFFIRSISNSYTIN